MKITLEMIILHTDVHQYTLATEENFKYPKSQSNEHLTLVYVIKNIDRINGATDLQGIGGNKLKSVYAGMQINCKAAAVKERFMPRQKWSAISNIRQSNR